MKKILLIEDDTDTVEVLGLLFEDKFNIISFNDLIPIEKIIGINPDLIILDNRLSSGLGSELCKEIKSNPLTGFIPVLLFSGDTTVQMALAAPLADALMEKPFDIYELENLVKHFTGDIKFSGG